MLILGGGAHLKTVHALLGKGAGVGVHTVKIIRYGTGTVYFIRFQYSNGIDTGYFLYFVDVFEILSRALVLGKVWWGWTSTM